MLRHNITTNLLSSVLIPFGFEYASAGSSVFESANNFNGITRSGAGVGTILHYENFEKAPIVITTPEIGPNALTTLSTAATTGTIAITRSESGSAADGRVQGFALGFYNPDPNTYERISPVRSNQVGTRVLPMSIDISEESFFAGSYAAKFKKNSTGRYTFTFRDAFRRAPIAVVQTIGTANLSAQVTNALPGSIDVYIDNAAGIPTDSDFDIIVFGQTLHPHGREQAHITSRRDSVRFLPFKVNETSGTPALDVGSQAASITDNGAGDYTITFNTPFVATPLVFATGTALRVVTQSKSLSTIRINLLDASSGTKTDGDCDLVVVGFDTLENI